MGKSYNNCMDMMTINISMPKRLYADAKRIAVKKRYASISELVRDAVRQMVHPIKLTVNGFTPEFEEMVLRAEKEPLENDIVWEGKESDLVKYVENKKGYGLHSKSKRAVGTTARFRG